MTNCVVALKLSCITMIACSLYVYTETHSYIIQGMGIGTHGLSVKLKHDV